MQLKCTTQIIFLATLVTQVSTSLEAQQQSQNTEEKIVIESLPPYLSARVYARDQILKTRNSNASVQKGLISTLKKWKRQQFPLRVCFYGRNQALHLRIKDVALKWSEGHPFQIFDFGDTQIPDTCNSRFTSVSASNLNPTLNYDIRIGFGGRGYWSTVGTDSIYIAQPYEQSMNFGGWEFFSPTEEEFEATVLHEFGHALGLEHEHQSPYSVCEQEFDWMRVNEYLSGDPNFWSPDVIEHNMRQLSEDGLEGEFDRYSIMLYSFPANFYLNGAASRCYTDGNNDLSDGDVSTIRAMYPDSVIESRRLFTEAASTIFKNLSLSSDSTFMLPAAQAELRKLGVENVEFNNWQREVIQQQKVQGNN